MASALALRIGIAVLVLSLAAPAAAQDRRYARCTAAERKEPTLSKTVFPTATFEMIEERVGQERGSDGQPVPTYLKHGVDKVRLADGIELEVNQGGCNYHGNAYRFRIAKTQTPLTDAAFWINEAISLIDLVEPGNIDKTINLPSLRRVLQERVGNPRAAAFRAGSIDGTIPYGGGQDQGRISQAYLVTVNQREGGTTVSVSYIIGPL